MSVTSIAKGFESWSAIRKELRKRTVEPIYHFSFVTYFFLAVVVVGGVGVWLELISYFFLAPKTPTGDASVERLHTAVITFFPALAGTASMQLIWAEDNQKFLRAFAILMLFFFFIVALAISNPMIFQQCTALIIGFIASGFALWTWWIANAKQQDYLDNLDAPLGKRDPQAELAGNLDDFKV
ncbi:MAG: hypothetical protein ABIN99_12715 [Nitrosospira sp.]